MRVLPLLGALCAACAIQPSIDRGRTIGSPVRNARIEDVPVRGFDVVVVAAERDVSGELLAIDAQQLWVLEDPEGEPQLVSIPRAEVDKVSVEVFPSGAATTWTWTAVGTLSTASHGFFLIFSAPIWLATGVPVSVDQIVSNDLDLTRRSQLDALHQFARFPQGMPPQWGVYRRRGRVIR